MTVTLEWSADSHPPTLIPVRMGEIITLDDGVLGVVVEYHLGLVWVKVEGARMDYYAPVRGYMLEAE